MQYPKKPGIYLLTNIKNGKIYYGKACNIKNRMSHHKWCEKRSDNDTYIGRAIKKHGWISFTVTIVETQEILDNEYLLDREEELIRIHDTTNKEIGYNIAKRGMDCAGCKRSEETREKLRLYHASHPKRNYNNSEEARRNRAEGTKRRYQNSKSPMYGKKHTQEAKDKISQANKGQISNRKRKVKQLDLEGNLIKIWGSISEVAKELFDGKAICSISGVCSKALRKNGFRIAKSAHGFKWEYAD